MQDLCYIMWDLSWLLPGLTALWQVGSWFPDQGSNIRSPAFQIGFFTTGLPGKSLCVFSFCTQRNVLIVDLLFLTCELLLKFTLIPNIKKKKYPVCDTPLRQPKERSISESADIQPVLKTRSAPHWPFILGLSLNFCKSQSPQV